MRFKVLLLSVLAIFIIQIRGAKAQCSTGVTIDFVTDTVCDGLTTTFTDLTTGFDTAKMTMSWDMEHDFIVDFNTRGDKTFLYPGAGTYNCMVTVVDTLGCADSLLKTVVVYGNPTSAFTATTVCVNNPVQFTNSSSSLPGSTFFWDFETDGTNDDSTNVNPSFTYGTFGNFVATLTIRDTTGCSAVSTQNVTVNNNPTAAFTNGAVCLNQMVNFTNTSINQAGATYSWDFENDGIADDTATNPGFTFTSLGTFTVALTVTDPTGCIDSVMQTVVVHTVPSANFSSTSICQGTATTFTNSSTFSSGATFIWDFDNDGITDSTSQNPTFVYSSAGTFTAILTVTDTSGCSSSTSQAVVVNARPVASFTSSVSCLNSPTTFTNTSTDSGTASYFWDLDNDGSVDSNLPNPSFTYSSAGTFTAGLLVLEPTGCADTVTNTVIVNPNPTASYTINTVCQGDSTFFTNTSSFAAGASFAWDFDNNGVTDNTSQNSSLVYSTPGTFMTTLTVTDPTGCSDIDSVAAIINLNPAADFSATTACLSRGADFTNNSVADTVATYFWDFDSDGVVESNLLNPTFIFATADTFVTTLVVTEPTGCSDTVSYQVFVNPDPSISFTAAAVCQGNATVFVDSSSYSAGATFAWDFESDGVTDDISTSPTFTYGAAGTYNATLIITNPTGCRDSAAVPVTVNIQPVANFTATSPVCLNAAINFTNSSTGSGSETNSWDFDNDGVIESNLVSPSFTYLTPGTFNATLIVSEATGCADTLSIPVTVNPNPAASFTAAAVCFGDTTQFVNTSTFANGASFAWDFENDGINDNTSLTPAFNYDTSGVFNVQLTIIDPTGCSDSTVIAVTVNANPQASFTNTTPCLNTPVQFTNTSTATPGINFNWDFNNDGTIDDSVNISPSFNYTTPGNFFAVLTAIDGNGCSSTVINLVTVNDNPVAQFTLSDTSCQNYVVAFADNSVSTNGATYAWDFDGNGATDSNTSGANTFTYTGTGSFTATLVVTNTTGCSDTFSDTVMILPSPVASFTVSNNSSGCQGAPIQFTNTSTSLVGGATFSWDFNNDALTDDTTSNPVHTYTLTGNYSATLTIVNPNGCMSSFVKNVTVTTNTLAVTAGIDKSVICGNSTSLTAAANQSGVTYLWSPASSLNNPFIGSPSATPTDTTDYIVRGTKNGCIAYDTVRVFVVPMSVDAGIDKSITCGSNAQLSAASNNTISVIYTWDPPTGLNNSGIRNPIATPTTTTTYVVTAVKGSCVAMDTIIVNVADMIANAGSDKTINCGSNTVLSSTSNAIAGATYSWSPATALSNTIVINPTANPTQSTMYTLTITKNGCMAVDSVMVNVVPFDISAGTDKYINCGNTTTLAATTSVTGVSYSWSPASSLSNPFIAGPIASPDVTTAYVVTAVKGQCTSYDTVDVFVDPNIPIAFSANNPIHTGFPPFNVQFSNQTPNPTRYTFEWDFGDGSTSNLTSPSHQYTVYGTYAVTLIAHSISGNCVDTLIKSPYIYFFNPNGVQQISADEALNVFPNPASQMVTININNQIFKNNYKLQLYNVLGEKVEISKSNVSSNSIQMDVSELNKGIYFIKIGNENVSTTKRLIVE